MKLVFQGYNGKERLVARVDSEEEAMREVKKFCDERDFKIRYTRCWLSEDKDFMWIDCSSHSEFFKLYFNDDEEGAV